MVLRVVVALILISSIDAKRSRLGQRFLFQLACPLKATIAAITIPPISHYRMPRNKSRSPLRLLNPKQPRPQHQVLGLMVVSYLFCLSNIFF